MYEEEDDDLPMQYRRFSALNPGQPYKAFSERFSTYMTGQIGMRNYLHQAIYDANQNAEQHRMMNAMILQQQRQSSSAGFVSSPAQSTAQPTWLPNSMSPQDTTIQTESFSHSPSQQQINSPTFAVPDARNMSLSLPSPGHRRNASNASASVVPSGPIHAQQQSPTTRPQSREKRLQFDDSDPLSSVLPVNQQQLLDANPLFAMGVHASQMTPGVPMPSTYQYQYNPNAKVNNTPGSDQFAFGHRRDLSQTLAPQKMHNFPYVPASSAISMPPSDLDFNDDLFAPSYDESLFFDFEQTNSGFGRATHSSSGQVTPGDSAWNPDDFLEFPTTM